MKYTYESKFLAHVGHGNQTVIIPDQVADNQKAYDGKTFPALLHGKKIRVKLDGEAYGLHTSGTGDPVVKRA